jgi:hypothetical protein
MRRHLLGLLFLCCCTAWIQSSAWNQPKKFSYLNLDDSTAVDDGLANAVGWGSCTTCAGGENESTAMIFTAPFQTYPSIDGASRVFNISGEQYANGAWWYKVGPNDQVNKFKFDFWVQVDQGTFEAQALEFDVFQYISPDGGTDYFWGTQCNYFNHTWEVWNEGQQVWEQTHVTCQKFVPGNWYHITLRFRRETQPQPFPFDKYESLTIVQYDRHGKIVCNQKHELNVQYPSGPLPADYTENMGVQFQMDIGPVGASMTEWVDKVDLYATQGDDDSDF